MGAGTEAMLVGGLIQLARAVALAALYEKGSNDKRIMNDWREELEKIAELSVKRPSDLKGLDK